MFFSFEVNFASCKLQLLLKFLRIDKSHRIFISHLKELIEFFVKKKLKFLFYININKPFYD